MTEKVWTFTTLLEQRMLGQPLYQFNSSVSWAAGHEEIWFKPWTFQNCLVIRTVNILWRFLIFVPSVSKWQWLNRCVCAPTVSRKGCVVRFMLAALDQRHLRWHEHDWQMPSEGTLINRHQCQSTHSISFSFQATVCVLKPSCPKLRKLVDSLHLLLMSAHGHLPLFCVGWG